MSAETEPTEEPSPRRLLKSRQQGQVAVSRDFSAAVSFVALVSVLVGAVPAGWARLLAFFRQSLAIAPRGAAPPLGDTGNHGAGLSMAAASAVSVAIPLLAIPLGVTMLVAILIGAWQTGALFAWQAARPDVSRLSPVAGFKRLLSPRTLTETAKALLKVGMVLMIAGTSLQWGARGLLRLAGTSPSMVMATLAVLANRMAARVALALVAWGLIDWLLARRRHRRSLMMTREQVKREYKEMEGDPRHRSERQRLHREISEQQMIEEVRKADFVVVNPEHIAVAVRYDRQADAAPAVVAKGERLLAERIKQVAREAGVPIYRDVGLARALNELPEGDEIPEVLYEAVAELLRVLWDIDNAPGSEAGSSRVSGDGADRQAGPRAEQKATASSLSAPTSWKRV